jgi:hypothetical protein
MENLNQPLDRGFAVPDERAGLVITEPVRASWREIANWSVFFAVLMFITIGIMALVFLVAAAMSKSFIVIIVGLGMLVVFFLPTWYLIRFANLTKNALFTGYSNDLHRGFDYFHRMYRFMGILLCVMIGLYAFVILGMFIGLSNMNL